MFIGEAPGENEDLEGKPFVGAAGKLLTKLINEILGLNRADVFITNIVKCRPLIIEIQSQMRLRRVHLI